jgi:hypothetical protein
VNPFEDPVPSNKGRTFRWTEIDRDTKVPLDDLLRKISRDIHDNPLNLRDVDPNTAAVDSFAHMLQGFASRTVRPADLYPEDLWERQQFEIRAAERADSWMESASGIYVNAVRRLGFEPFDHGAQLWHYGLSGFLKHRLTPLLELAFGVTNEDRQWLDVAPNSPSRGATIARLKIGAVRRIVERLDAEWGVKTWPDYTSPLIEAMGAMARYNARERAAARLASGSASPGMAGSTSVTTNSGQLKATDEIPVGSRVVEATDRADATSTGDPIAAPSEASIQAELPNDLHPKAPPLSVLTWQAVEISFLSDERVQIRCGTSLKTLNYAEFGFADGRNEKPNLPWATLRAMASEGVIRDTAKTGGSWPKIEKHIQEIRRVLREHFGIEEDPIPFVKDVGYRACFKIGLSRSFDS